MDDAYRHTKRVLLQARNQLEALESASANAQLDPQASALVASSFHANMQQLDAQSSHLRKLLASQPPAAAHVWNARVADLQHHMRELRQRHARCNARFRSIRNERSMREELFQRRAAARGVAAGGDAAAAAAAAAAAHTVIGMGSVDESRSLNNSSHMASSIMRTGAGALEKLISQRARLRNVRTNVMDVMKQLGVDRRIIARIERREWSDMVLMYSLMTLLLLLLALAVWYKYQR